MIDMCEQSRYVALAAGAFNEAQAVANRARDTLNAELYREFCELSGGIKAGDRIHCGGIQGRAVIQRNGTSMGLYLRCVTGALHPIPLPYKDHVAKVPYKPKTKKNK